MTEFWLTRPRAELEERRDSFTKEQARYLEGSPEWREVQWYLDVVTDVLARKP